MDAEQYAKVRSLFFDVCERLESGDLRPDQVAEHIDREAEDDEVARQVRSMLAHHNAEAAVIEGQTIGAASAQAAASKVSVHGDADPAAAASTEHPEPANPSADHAGPAESSTAAARGGEPTLSKAMRTHASPRYANEPILAGRSLPRDLLAAKARRQFRLTGTWLYLLFLIPTAAVGLWTYLGIRDQLRTLVANELDGVSSGVRLSADRFLQDKARLVSSWSRTPNLRDAVQTLTSAAGDDPDALRSHPAIDTISDELRSLSGTDQIKFVIWNRAMTTIASWTPDRGDVGLPVHHSGAMALAKSMSGQTVLFGPERLTSEIPGFAPETDDPVVGMITPIYDDRDRVIATMLIRGLGWFDQLAGIFSRTTMATRMDAYMVNRDGIMLTPSMIARTAALEGKLDYAPDAIAAAMRVVDPGTKRLSPTRRIDRETRPITMSVADLRKPPYGVRIEPYKNYAGIEVVGASQILNDWDLGVIVESPVAEAFAPVRLVRNSYLSLATLLLVSSLYAAARIAKQSTDDSAAVHPLARYDVVAALGSGGMGTVYQVRHKVLGRDSALKILPDQHQRKEDQSRFDREARLAASLANPHSVTIYDYGRSPEGNAYCVMEYLRGLTLAEVVARDGPQPVGRVLAILRQVCDALIEGHAGGLCHRDIKPQNIMLSLDRSVGDWAVVFDYGLAKPLTSDAGMYQTAETVWSGTPMYMAPERFRDPSTLDPRSDIYSLGAVAYFMLAGKPPFLETEPESLFSLILSEDPIKISIPRGEGIPADVEDWVSSMMAKSVDDRVSTMLAASKMLDSLRLKHPWSADEANVWWKLHG